MLGKLKAWALGGLALLSSLLFGLLQLTRARRFKDQKDAAERQRDAVNKANQALHTSQEKSREDILEAKKRAARGEFDGMNNNW